MSSTVPTARGAFTMLALYAIFTLAIALMRNAGAAAWVPSVVVLLLVAMWWFRFARRVDHTTGVQPPPTSALWLMLPVVLLPLLYAQVGALVAHEPMHDSTVVAIEQRWFGDPSHSWAERWPWLPLSTLLHACYLSYYLIIYVPPLRLAWQRKWSDLSLTALALTLVFIVSCSVFVLWPVEGPRYLAPTHIDASSNPIRQFVLVLLERFSSRGAAFPSSHVSVSVVQTIIAWRTQPKLGRLLSFVTAGLAVGAVYGGFHYLVDVVVGAGVGALVGGGILWMQRATRRTKVEQQSVGAVALIMFALLPLAGCATAPVNQHRFYESRPYGTERQFNPVTEIVNEGFDLLRSDDADRRVFDLPYAVTARNLRTTLANPEFAFGQYGWSHWISHELLPLTLKNHGGGQWVPNYQFHLLGSGMISARMAEWFDARGFSHPVLWSAVTMTASHVLNEMTERPNPHSQDAATDLLIFDPAGFLLFRLDGVQRAFSGRVQLTNWPLQPSYTLPGRTLENVGQEYVLRFPLPKTKNWRGLYMFGLSTLLGVSRDFDNGRSLSAAIGADAVDNPVADPNSNYRTVTLKAKAGIFYDRDGSLLMSLVARKGYESLATFNMYPGVVIGRNLPFGLWASPIRGGKLRFGIASVWGMGVAHGPETQR